MQQIEVTDEWLYQYMPIVDEAIIRELEESTDYEYRFSAKFERKMRRLIWKEAHPQLPDSGFLDTAYLRYLAVFHVRRIFQKKNIPVLLRQVLQYIQNFILKT